jgi:fucose permease
MILLAVFLCVSSVALCIGVSLHQKQVPVSANTATGGLFHAKFLTTQRAGKHVFSCTHSVQGSMFLRTSLYPLCSRLM